MKVFKVLFLVYLFLKPLYFFDSGVPQLSDFLLLPTIVLFFSNDYKYLILNLKKHKYLLVFLGVVSIINIVHAINDANGFNFKFILATFYYIYNAALLIFCVSLFKNYNSKDYRNFIYILFSTLLLQFILLSFNIDKGIVNNFKGREYLYFNNPNQLSYYCLLLLTILFLCRKTVKLAPSVFTLSVSIALVLLLYATSFVGLLGGVFFLLIYLYYILREKAFSQITLLLLPFLLVLSLKSGNINEEFIRVGARFENPEKRTIGSYEGRGYARIFEYPEYLLYGAGEGNNLRFVTSEVIKPQEIHNTILLILFSYGVIGLLVFILFLYFLLKAGEISYYLYLLPILFYNTFHNGIRFSLVWILFAVIYSPLPMCRLNK